MLKRHTYLLMTMLLLLAFSFSACKTTAKTDPAIADQFQSNPAPEVTQTQETSGTDRNDTFDDDSWQNNWHAVSYVTLADVTSALSVGNGALTLTVNEVDRAPILVSNPIPLKSGDILQITRKVRMHYANDYFTGALRITGLQSGELNLTPDPARWDANLGKILVNLDYLHYFYLEDKKAATDGFVLYNVTDGGFSPAEIATPVFDDWFEETLTYNTATGEVTWVYGYKEYKAAGIALTQPAVSVVMHNYGWYTGHSMDLDSVSIKVTPAS